MSKLSLGSLYIILHEFKCDLQHPNKKCKIAKNRRKESKKNSPVFSQSNKSTGSVPHSLSSGNKFLTVLRKLSFADVLHYRYWMHQLNFMAVQWHFCVWVHLMMCTSRLYSPFLEIHAVFCNMVMKGTASILPVGLYILKAFYKLRTKLATNCSAPYSVSIVWYCFQMA